MALARSVASASDLLAEALGQKGGENIGGDDGIIVHGPSPPPCIEPYCGGFHWSSVPPQRWWKGEAQRIAAAEADSGGAKPDEQAGKDKADADASKGEAGGAKKDEKAVKPPKKEPELVLLDLATAKFHPALNPPIGDYVKLNVAGEDNFDWWNVPNVLRVTIKKKRQRHLLAEVLDDFMRVKEYVRVGGKNIPPGLRLVAIKPKGEKLRVIPWLQGRAALEDKYLGNLPLELTFGGRLKGQPALPEDTPLMHREPDLEPLVLPVKRLDIELGSREPPQATDLAACVQQPGFQVEITLPELEAGPEMFEAKLFTGAARVGLGEDDVKGRYIYTSTAQGDTYGYREQMPELTMESFPLTVSYRPPKCESMGEWMERHKAEGAACPLQLLLRRRPPRRGLGPGRASTPRRRAAASWSFLAPRQAGRDAVS